MGLSRTLILTASSWRWVEALVQRSFLFRPVVRRFIAGVTLDEAMAQAESLVSRGFLVSLDCLGENTTTQDGAKESRDLYLQLLDRIRESPHRDFINISIKLTQCGLDLGDEIAEEHYRTLLQAAQPANTFVRVDMESSAYTKRTIRMLDRVWTTYKNTGTVLQSYLKRSPADVEHMIAIGARVRLVKGAYLEPESVAFQSKADVDRAFEQLGRRLLDKGVYPALATHDERLIKKLKRYAQEQGIGKDRFEWQMLFGIRRDVQESLLREGYSVRVYVPFGPSWYPYFTRRLAERPANVWFIFKALFQR